MTITLHWWMIPIAVIALGALLYWLDVRQGGILPGILGALIFIACVFVALAFCVGYWTAAI